MEYDKDKVDETTLALLYLVLHGRGGEERAWKGFDWETMNRLHEKGYIHDPRSKAKSVLMTTEGAKRAAELFAEKFGRTSAAPLTQA